MFKNGKRGKKGSDKNEKLEIRVRKQIYRLLNSEEAASCRESQVDVTRFKYNSNGRI